MICFLMPLDSTSVVLQETEMLSISHGQFISRSFNQTEPRLSATNLSQALVHDKLSSDVRHLEEVMLPLGISVVHSQNP
jgi:hypothetical protein